ncbi:MAG: hypothetical protein KIT22_09235 [Verrucomicrobiae bacterium]|nr:hypothetical protein [Verrucomicrobiae bacterium]
MPYRLRIIDATDVMEPGDTGTSLRMHYSLRLPELTCDHYELSDAHGREKLGRFNFRRGELVLSDRGYSHRAGMAAVLESSAHVVLRWNLGPFPWRDLRARSGTCWRRSAALGCVRSANGP